MRFASHGLLIATCWSCGGEAIRTHDPPEPPAEAVEPLLAEHIREATRAVLDEPTSADAWGRLGEIYDVNSFPEQALFCYARARELDPDEWRWPYFAGLLLRPGDPVSALDRFAVAAELEPEYAALQFHLGFAHYIAESFEQAERHYRRALEIDPGCVNARLGLARVAVARGAPRAALPHLEQAVRFAADEGAVHLHLAQVYHELGRHADAVKEEQLTVSSRFAALPDGLTALDDPVREEVKQREGASSTRLVEEALHYLRQGREEQAARAAEKALEADPDAVPALLVSAQLLVKGGELDRARTRLERAVELDDGHSAVLFELGTVHAMAGRIERAIDLLQRTREIDPTFPAIKSNLAGLLVRAGRAQEAVALLREASLERPKDVYVQSKLATVLLDLGRFEEAVPILGGIVDREPGRIDARTNLGSALWNLRRYAEAIPVFRQGVEVAPDDPALNRWLAWALATCPREGLRDGRRALAIARRLCEQTSFSHPEFLDTLAAAQAETGDFEGAVRMARTGLEIFERAFQAQAANMSPEQTRRFADVSKQLRERVALYERGLPYRDGG